LNINGRHIQSTIIGLQHIAHVPNINLWTYTKLWPSTGTQHECTHQLCIFTNTGLSYECEEDNYQITKLLRNTHVLKLNYC